MSLYDDLNTEDFGGWSLGATAKPSPQPGSTSSQPESGKSAAITTPKPAPSTPVDPAITKERNQLAAVATAAALKRAAAESASKQQRTSAAGSSGGVPDIRKVADTSELPIRFNALTGKLERGPPVSSASPFQSDFSISFTGVADEYDPAKPNDYEEVLRKRERERANQKSSELTSTHRRRRRGSGEGSSSGSDEEERSRLGVSGSTPVSKGAAIAPPRILLEDDLKPKASVEESPKSGLSVGAMLGLSSASPNQSGGSGGGGSTIASRIMAKMGYKAGQGLGRQEQGMSRALQVEKTSLRGGRIIHEDDEDDKAVMPPPPPPPVVKEDLAPLPPVTPTTELLKSPSKVVVLRNMVGQGEVDEQLEAEVTEECQKYGRVVKCLVFELRNARDEEAVRIFLEFDRQEAATKALIDLNGRFFGGRNVRANFYSVDKFRAFELGDVLP